MSIIKIRKPNDDLKRVIDQKKLSLYKVTVSEDSLKIVYRNEEDFRALRLLIETAIPSHLLDDEIFKSFVLKDFEVEKVSKYMGHTTFKCRKIVFEDQDGDRFALEVI